MSTIRTSLAGLDIELLPSKKQQQQRNEEGEHQQSPTAAAQQQQAESEEREMRFYDNSPGIFPDIELKRVLDEQRDTILCLDFSPSGAYLACSSMDRSIAIISTSSWTKVQHHRSISTAFVSALKFSPDELFLAYSSDAFAVRFIDAPKWNLHISDTFLLGASGSVHVDKINSIQWTSDATKVVTVSDAHFGKIAIWDFKTKRVLMVIQRQTTTVDSIRIVNKSLSCMRLSDNDDILLGSRFGSVLLARFPQKYGNEEMNEKLVLKKVVRDEVPLSPHNIRHANKLETIPVTSVSKFFLEIEDAHQRAVTCCAWSTSSSSSSSCTSDESSQQQFFLTGSADATAKLWIYNKRRWSQGGDKPEVLFTLKKEKSAAAAVTAVAFLTSDQDYAVVCDAAGIVRLWWKNDGSCFMELDHGNSSLSSSRCGISSAISAHGPWLAFGTDGERNNCRIAFGIGPKGKEIGSPFKLGRRVGSSQFSSAASSASPKSRSSSPLSPELAAKLEFSSSGTEIKVLSNERDEKTGEVKMIEEVPISFPEQCLRCRVVSEVCKSEKAKINVTLEQTQKRLEQSEIDREKAVDIERFMREEAERNLKNLKDAAEGALTERKKSVEELYEERDKRVHVEKKLNEAQLEIERLRFELGLKSKEVNALQQQQETLIQLEEERKKNALALEQKQFMQQELQRQHFQQQPQSQSQFSSSSSSSSSPQQSSPSPTGAATATSSTTTSQPQSQSSSSSSSSSSSPQQSSPSPTGAATAGSSGSFPPQAKQSSTAPPSPVEQQNQHPLSNRAAGSSSPPSSSSSSAASPSPLPPSSSSKQQDEKKPPAQLSSEQQQQQQLAPSTSMSPNFSTEVSVSRFL